MNDERSVTFEPGLPPNFPKVRAKLVAQLQCSVSSLTGNLNRTQMDDVFQVVNAIYGLVICVEDAETLTEVQDTMKMMVDEIRGQAK